MKNALEVVAEGQGERRLREPYAISKRVVAMRPLLYQLAVLRRADQKNPDMFADALEAAETLRLLERFARNFGSGNGKSSFTDLQGEAALSAIENSQEAIDKIGNAIGLKSGEIENFETLRDAAEEAARKASKKPLGILPGDKVFLSRTNI
ncbi:hypothetical protein [Parvularcula lutaonensis]|uniref:Uncharacterized protein n=1 Tax=Parvularcula lutaonensis TaxID=491923 RepID=A0ABV7MBD4_9PROT|nr:hypothetical protein [Parvularcula lutaonensis]GGY47261.1 hypothetical protein GCM10007148_15700 [Parvularcula lutaonensis]